MILDHPLRLPLSTGASPANLALGLAVIGFLGAGPVFFGSVLPGWVALVCGILIAVWFFALVSFPFIFKRQRASDVVLDARGLLIASGPHAEHRLSWEQLGEAAQRTPHGPLFEELSSASESTGVLSLPGGVRITSEEPDERESLRDLARTLAVLAQGAASAQVLLSSREVSSQMARCPKCGAPLIPTAEERSDCRFCGASAPLPESLRQEVQHVRELERHRAATRQTLTILRRWPRATRVNAVLGLATVPLVLGWPASAVLASEFFQCRDLFSWRDVGVLFVGTFALTLGWALWAQGQIVHRRAFAFLAATFHARVIDAERHILGCRHCGAPLGASPDSPLVVCVYCATDNVLLGLELPPQVQVEARQSVSLDALAKERAQSLQAWRMLSLAALLAVLAGAGLLWEPIHRAVTSASPSHACVDRSWSYRLESK